RGCFPQLTTYQVNANASFWVTGAQAGSLAAGEEGPNGCRPQTGRDPRLISRIPLRPAPDQKAASIICDSATDPPVKTFPTLKTAPAQSAADGFYIDHFVLRLKPKVDPPGLVDQFEVPVTATTKTRVTQEAPQMLAWMNDWTKQIKSPNACSYLAGP